LHRTLEVSGMDLETLPLVPIALVIAGLVVGYLIRGMSERRQPEHPLSLQSWTRETDSDPRLEAAAALGAARGAKAVTHPHLGMVDRDRLGQIARLVASIVKLWRKYPGRERVVLWVDDNPANNAMEALALASLGITMVSVTTTEQAMKAALERRYYAIISDLERGGDRLAGFVLLEALRQRGDSTPFVMYSGSATAMQKLDVKRRGALDCTDDPQELVRLVNQAVLISMSRVTD
jgi:CheY-like chemotaxis protein